MAGTLILQPVLEQPAAAQSLGQQVIGCPEGFDVAPAVAAPPPPMKSLKTVGNPVLPNGAAGAIRADLAPFIANQAAAIQLGKAFFWDMQVGSDNKTACATCHASGGGDVRAKGQIHPGANGSFDTQNSNYALTGGATGDFPFSTPTSTDLHDNAAGSQGVRKAKFIGMQVASNGSVTEITGPPDVADTTFGGRRQTTGMNAPSTINAVFNHRNFFNGRAQNEFNGVNPFGTRDLTANVWSAGATPASIFQTRIINIQNAGLASQAVGPVLNSVEMSAEGRTFPDVGRKMLGSKPLALQTVDTRDSVLGRLAETRIKGLKTTYAAMIQAAFQPEWWNSTNFTTINGKNYNLMEANFSLYWGLSVMLYEATLVANDSPMDQYLDGRQFTAAGLLKSDGNLAKLNAVAKRMQTEYGYQGGVAGIVHGLQLFEKPLVPAAAPNGRECIACHLGAPTTSATVNNIVEGQGEPAAAAFLGVFDLRMERMFMDIPPVKTDVLGLIQSGTAKFGTTEIAYDPTAQDPPNGVAPANYTVTGTKEKDFTTNTETVVANPSTGIAIYDAGFYNVGLRPVAEDPGVGGLDPFNQPLSFVNYLQTTGGATKPVLGGTLGCIAPTYPAGGTPPILRDALGVPFFPNQALNTNGFPLLSGPIKKTEVTDSQGSFKTSSLRNLEVNGPYFHNGGKSTLAQVLEFYDDGGDFPKAIDPARSQLFPADRRSPLMKFYDFLAHSGLEMTPNEKRDLVAFLIALTDDRVRFEKAPFDHPELILPAGESAANVDEATTIPAVGALGRATALKPFLSLNPFSLN